MNNWFRRVAILFHPALIGAAGFSFVLYLVMQTKPGVFFSGDAGLKFLMTEQFARGDFLPYLDLPAPPWVKTLWQQGYFPFKPQFVYLVHQHFFSQYPLFFSFLSAPLYAAFGYLGLYVIPVLALFSTWYAVERYCTSLDFAFGLKSLALLFLIFASPLTVYGAMYWEHTLGVALSTGGLALYLTDRTGDIRKAVLGGALLGLSFWFRAESIVLITLAVSLTWIPYFRRRLSNKRIFAASAGMTLVAFLLFNFAFYGTPLGLYALQLKLPKTPLQRLIDAGRNLHSLLILLVDFFPAAIVVTGCGVYTFLHRKACDARLIPVLFLCVLSLLFTLLCPFILLPPEMAGPGGKQWGARFLLGMVPSACMVMPYLVQTTWQSSQILGRTLLAASVAATLLCGVRIDSFGGAAALARDYATRTFPALREVERSPAPVVLVEDQYIAQELAAAMKDKRFIMASNGAEMNKICTSALHNHISQLLFVSNGVCVFDGERISDEVKNYDGMRIKVAAQPDSSFRVSLVGVAGIYAIYQVMLEKVPAAPPMPIRRPAARRVPRPRRARRRHETWERSPS